MKLLLFFSVSIVGLLSAGLFNPAEAQPNYCSLNEVPKKVELHLFGESYQSEDDKQYFLTGMQRLYSAFEMGDAIKIIIHKGRSTRIAMDECLPGCPETGLLEGLFSNSCSEQIAKKDMISFQQKYVGSMKKAAKSSGVEFDIFDHLTNLQDYFSQRDPDESETFVFHSLVPYGTGADDEDSLDRTFVKMTQNHQLSELKLPQVQFVNTNPSKPLREFWKDLGLKGHETGLQVKFDRTIID